MTEQRTVNLSDVCVDESLQPRCQIDYVVVADYAERMKEGDTFPPIDLFDDGQVLWLADGFHRVYAARDYAGLSSLPARIQPGSQREAKYFSLGANTSHGLRRTNADKARVVEQLLADEEWRKKPDTEIAHHCGVTSMTVGNYRKAIIKSFNDSEEEEEREVTRNGTTYKQKVKKKRAKDEAPEVMVIQGDAQYLAQHVEAGVDLVVTSPPYNVGVEYATYADDLSTFIPFLTQVWRQCYEVMNDGGRIAVVVPFGIGRNPYDPFACRVMSTLTLAGFDLRGQIIWDKGTTGNRTTWGSFRMSSDPAIRDTTECIIVAHKRLSTLPLPASQRLKDEKGAYTTWLQDSDYFMELAQDHWQVAPESAARIGHPAPFPTELVRRLIHFYGFPGCHVVDPFAGSGTVGVVAKELRCRATLVEQSLEYCQLAEERIHGS